MSSPSASAAPATQSPVTPTPPAASPVAPAQAGQGILVQVDPSAPHIYTQADVDALNAKKDALSTQLSSAQRRRNDVARDLKNAPEGAARTGLEQRLQVLDGRLAQLETDIASNGRLLAQAPGALLAASSTEPPPVRYGPFTSGQLTAVSIIFTISVLLPLSIGMARAMVRRFSAPKPAPQILESAARLERMEQAVDSIAVEIERISESQRWVTNLMAKHNDTPSLRAGSGGAEPIREPEAGAVRVGDAL